MNTNIPPRKKNAENEETSPEITPEYISPYHHEVNITDGSEFLDDAIRIKDQPLGETEPRGDE